MERISILLWKIFLTLLIVGIFWIAVRFIIGGSEDDWICVDGQWVKHGAPSAPMPAQPCR